MMYIFTRYANYFLADGLDVSKLPHSDATGDTGTAAIGIVLPIVFGALGAIALLIIVVSGLRYVVSAGDPAKMTQAKKAILYALVGLVIALSGFSIVTFVVKGLG
jgi:hypothetical protein